MINKLPQHQRKKIPRNQHEEHEEEKESEESENVEESFQQIEEPDSRIVGLYGTVNEEKCSGAIGALYHLKETGKFYIANEEKEMILQHTPINFIISTEGGMVTDMFSVYDVIKDINHEGCEINTFGLGHVMSAGVLILAAGTKGKRKIGKNCRLMIHNISSGNYGAIHDLESNVTETKWYEDRYIKCLSENSKLTEKQIVKIFKKKMDHFFDAEQAVEWGIADIIV